ncbi:MAG TPA: NAD(P)-binding domain-containing protein [Microbacterium sp.]|nr:NAD(P)-binding domain-containing protein [Microbacterium sp.]
MSKVTIFGDGNMGSAIAGIVAAGGSDVEHITTTTEGATVNGDVVVLAVPYAALQDITAQYGEQFAGRVVVDVTNPLDYQTGQRIPADSATAELAAALPQSKVVKAFNTTFAPTLASRTVGGQPTTVLVAGDDADAKQSLIELVTAGGVHGIDAGPLSAAQDLEVFAALQIRLAMSQQVAFDGGFAVVK